MNQNPRSSSNPYKQVCVHPILFAVYPILFIYNSNFAYVDGSEMIRPLAILVALTGVFWWLIRRFGEDAGMGPLLLSIGLLILFSYAPWCVK